MVDKVVANSLSPLIAFEFRFSWIVGTILFLVSFPKQEDGPFNWYTAQQQVGLTFKLKMTLAGWGSLAPL